MEQAGIITIGLFMVSVIFYAGRVSVRLETLEQWRKEVRGQMNEIFKSLRRIEQHMAREGEE